MKNTKKFCIFICHTLLLDNLWVASTAIHLCLLYPSITSTSLLGGKYCIVLPLEKFDADYNFLFGISLLKLPFAEITNLIFNIG